MNSVNSSPSRPGSSPGSRPGRDVGRAPPRSVRGSPPVTPSAAATRGPREGPVRASQPVACFTSAAIRASTSGVTSVRANPVAHIEPSSR